MPGLGTLINSAGIVFGGLTGLAFGRFLKELFQETLNMACGISVLFIGIAGAMEKMLQVEEGGIRSGRSLMIVLCMALGAVIGEAVDIESRFERFGEWLKRKTGNAKDQNFVNAFVTASLTVCIGAMAIVGAIRDGISGDWSVLATKGILDFVIILVMTCSMGKGCLFSSIPVFLFEGAVTLLAVAIKPFMTEAALDNLSLIGSILIFCVGLNLVWGKKVRVANLLPAILLAIVLPHLF